MNLSGKTLLFRVDASAIIGAGHVMRCLALAQAWQDGGGKAVFACCSLPDIFAQRLIREKMEVRFLAADCGSGEDIHQLLKLAAGEKVAAIFVDLYRVEEPYLKAVLDPRWKLICADDNSELVHYPVDFVLNQNIHATNSLYAAKCEEGCLLLGPGFALLRREFAEYRKWTRNVSDRPETILITMGGGDQIATLILLTDKIREALKNLKVSIVLARDYPNTPVLEKHLQTHNLNFRILLAPENMARELADHDLLISSGGATVWEALYMQIPSIFVAIVQNQQASCNALRKFVPHPVFGDLAEMAPRHLDHLIQDAGQRRLLAESGRQTVDGIGSQRVIQSLQQVSR